MQIQEIETEKLNFDPENPRFFRLDRELDLDETVSEMLEDEGVKDLMESIGTKGYFPGEPLLVTEDAGRYIVMEGNRRLAAVKLLELRALLDEDRSFVKFDFEISLRESRDSASGKWRDALNLALTRVVYFGDAYPFEIPDDENDIIILKQDLSAHA